MKWEYVTVPLISHALQEILNQWGEEGWELVQVLESPATGTTGYLKRPKAGDPTPTDRRGRTGSNSATAAMASRAAPTGPSGRPTSSAIAPHR